MSSRQRPSSIFQESSNRERSGGQNQNLPSASLKPPRNINRTPVGVSRSPRTSESESFDIEDFLAVSELPELIEIGKNIYFVIGNLPEKYTLEDVEDLVTEVNLIGISMIEETPKKLRFCLLSVSKGDAKILKKKLNGLTIAGKTLMAYELCEILDGYE